MLLTHTNSFVCEVTLPHQFSTNMESFLVVRVMLLCFPVWREGAMLT